MIKLAYDFHIHSCLSPCADNDMTPANIVGMSALKGLDVIALTDHNTCRNCTPFMQLARENNIMAIPGMELTTAEEVHVVCLFHNIEDAMLFDKEIYDKLVKVHNRPDIFGEQLVMDEQENVVSEEEYLLINATTVTFDEAFDIIKKYNGVMIPAHIDKNANSVIANLGFVPADSRFSCVEVKNIDKLHTLRQSNPYLENCNVVVDSDAHYLEYISEPVNYLTVRERNIDAVLEALEWLGRE